MDRISLKFFLVATVILATSPCFASRNFQHAKRVSSRGLDEAPPEIQTETHDWEDDFDFRSHSETVEPDSTHSRENPTSGHKGAEQRHNKERPPLKISDLSWTSPEGREVSITYSDDETEFQMYEDSQPLEQISAAAPLRAVSQKVDPHRRQRFSDKASESLLEEAVEQFGSDKQYLFATRTDASRRNSDDSENAGGPDMTRRQFSVPEMFAPSLFKRDSHRPLAVPNDKPPQPTGPMRPLPRHFNQIAPVMMPPLLPVPPERPITVPMELPPPPSRMIPTPGTVHPPMFPQAAPPKLEARPQQLPQGNPQPPLESSQPHQETSQAPSPPIAEPPPESSGASDKNAAQEQAKKMLEMIVPLLPGNEGLESQYEDEDETSGGWPFAGMMVPMSVAQLPAKLHKMPTHHETVEDPQPQQNNAPNLHRGPPRPPQGPPQLPNGPPHAPPRGPPGHPHGPAQLPYGPPHAQQQLQQGPPHGPPQLPQGPPHGPPQLQQGPPHGPPQMPPGPPHMPPQLPPGPPHMPPQLPHGPPHAQQQLSQGLDHGQPQLQQGPPHGQPQLQQGPPHGQPQLQQNPPHGPPQMPPGPPHIPPQLPHGPRHAPPQFAHGPPHTPSQFPVEHQQMPPQPPPISQQGSLQMPHLIPQGPPQMPLPSPPAPPQLSHRPPSQPQQQSPPFSHGSPPEPQQQPPHLFSEAHKIPNQSALEFPQWHPAAPPVASVAQQFSASPRDTQLQHPHMASPQLSGSPQPPPEAPQLRQMRTHASPTSQHTNQGREHQSPQEHFDHSQNQGQSMLPQHHRAPPYLPTKPAEMHPFHAEHSSRAEYPSLPVQSVPSQVQAAQFPLQSQQQQLASSAQTGPTLPSPALTQLLLLHRLSLLQKASLAPSQSALKPPLPNLPIALQMNAVRNKAENGCRNLIPDPALSQIDVNKLSPLEKLALIQFFMKAFASESKLGACSAGCSQFKPT